MSDSGTFADRMARRSLEALEQKYPGSTQDARNTAEAPVETND